MPDPGVRHESLTPPAQDDLPEVFPRTLFPGSLHCGAVHSPMLPAAASSSPDHSNGPDSDRTIPRHPRLKVHRPGPLASTFFVLVAVFTATMIRWALDQAVGDKFPFLTFYLATALLSWHAGRLPGFCTLLLSSVSIHYFFLEPRFTFSVADTEKAAGTALFLFAGCVLVTIFEARRRSFLHAVNQAELLQVTLASIGDGVITTDHRGRITHMNSLAAHLTGWDCDEAVGQPLEKVFALVDAGTRQPLAKSSQPIGTPALLHHRDGGEHWIESTVATLPAHSGPTGSVVAFRDVTARRHAELEAEASLKKAQLVADAVPSLISYVSTDLRYLLTNQTYEEWFERPRHQINGLTMEELLGSAAWEKLSGHVMKALSGEHVYYESEIPYRGHRGKRWIAASYTPDIGEDGITRGLVAHVVDITAHKHAEQALRESEERLREADRRKDEFLATLAHELRNPLAPVRNALELLNHAGTHSDLSVKARATLDRQVGHMVHLIDDLLDVSRINTGRLVLRRERTDLREAIRHAVDASRVFIDQQRHSLQLDLPVEPVWIDADPVRLTQVFSNLLNNAAKYTDPGGTISLRIERDGHEAVVKVRDNGIGIPQEKLAHIFDLFAQLDSSLEKSAGGLGIGLSLVKRLVELHGGSVRVGSGGPGLGSEFICRFHLVTHAAVFAPVESTPSADPVRPLRILIVDDNRDSADLLALILQKDGHLTHRAYDGVEALDAITAFSPQLILLDLGLPRMNGYDVCRTTRRTPQGEATFIAALTGWGQESDRQETRAAGFDAHFVKPVRLPELKQFIATLPLTRTTSHPS
ncbi:MAG: PAS domain S-box protein [Verrucomicrobiaceae bacterium]|nr:MAG: PAS domain S-box protein [Verrucomicrobiaceae bacterium]